MKKYFKIDNRNIVVQVQPNKEENFIETSEDVVCGMKYEKGIFVVIEDLDAKVENQKLEAKLQKEKELSELVINHNTVLYDAHGEALGNMATVIAIANATYNRAISVGINGTIMDLVDAYNYVYKNQTVTWKGADNKPHTVQLESLVEASQKAMTAKAEILFKY